MAQEREILMRMATSTEFLRAIIPSVRPEYFKSSYARLVATWIAEYWGDYKKAPNADLQAVYQRKINELGDDEETQDALDAFLIRLSKDYAEGPEQVNIPFVIKEAIGYMKMRSLEDLRDKLEVAIIEKDTLGGEQLISNFMRVEAIGDSGVSLMRDHAKIAAAFLEEDEALFTLPGDLSAFGNFVRQDLVAFLAASKRGKSWWAMYCAQVAMYRGWKVVYFNLEMAAKQPIRRFWTMIMGQPRKTADTTIPFFEETEDSTEARKMYRVESKIEKREGMDLSKIATQQRNFRRMTRSGNIRIVSLPAYSATIEDIEAHLDNLTYYDRFIPDVIIIDQGDLVAPSKGFKGEYRHMLDDIWKKMRRMAQERDALVISPTQGGRASFKKDAAEDDIAEDIRKITHVSKMIAINMSKKDREMGVCRLQMLAERDGVMRSEQVICLQALDIGKVCLDSRRASRVEKLGE